uniref:MAM domain-containing protein n=1 Tax=Globodera pallida TaxID=36090 RepID=A0A183C5J4_GLOPA
MCQPNRHRHHPILGILLLPLPLFLPFLPPPSRACAPPLSPPFLANNFPNPNPNIASRHSVNSRAFGEQIHLPESAAAPTEAPQNGVGGGIEQRASTASGPVREPKELFCYDFDDKCRWRNMEGFLVDDLDWYQGNGFLDENRLRNTHGFYGIAATDKVELSSAKGILVSDVVQCQTGTAELRFMYWTSPEVKITVCVKSILRLFPYFDYCSKPVENNDPGPAYVTLPDLGGESLQIFIQAHNFVFNSAALQGGFAIIDNLEYYGEFCDSADGYQQQHFAQSNAAPSETVSRPSPMPKSSASERKAGNIGLGGPELAYNNVVENAQSGGFSSLLDWMLYGGGGGLGHNGTTTAAAANKLLSNILPNNSPLQQAISPNSSPFEPNLNALFPTLVASQAIGGAPSTAGDVVTPPTLEIASGVQQPSSASLSAFRPLLTSSPAVQQSKSLTEAESVRPYPDIENPLNSQILPNPMTSQSEPAAAAAASVEPLQGLRSLRIVQQNKGEQLQQMSAENGRAEEDDDQSKAFAGRPFPGGDNAAALQKGLSQHQHQQQFTSVPPRPINSRRPLPHLALLNKRKMGERTEVAERDEEEEADGRGGMMNGDEEGRGEEGVTEEPNFVEREEWIGR